MNIRCAWIAITVGSFAVGIDAQSSVSLTGSVKDPQGRAVPGASVTVVSRSGGAGSATTSGSNGAYRFQDLPAGDYLMRVEAAGFATFLAEDVHLAAGVEESRDVVLQVAGVREQVVVTAASTPQTPDEVSKAVTVIDASDAEARDNSSLSDAVDLAPGVRVQQLGGPGAYTTIQIRGLPTEDTALLVDGMRLRDASATQGDASDMIEDLLLTDTSRIEVMNGAGSSLYGTNAIGGVVNVITDEGGGRTRGSLLVEGGSLGTLRARARLAGGALDGRIEYSFGAAETDVMSGVGGDQPFRDLSTQGRVTFRLSPRVRLTMRIYGGDTFTKVFGEPDIIGAANGVGIVQAVPLAPALLGSYESGAPPSEINAGNATFIPAPDDPDSTRAARFLAGALTLAAQPSANFDYSVSYQAVANSRRFGDGPAGVGFQPDGSTRSLYDGRIQTVNAHFNYRVSRWNLLTGGYELESENYANDYSDRSDPLAASAVNVTQSSHAVFLQDQVRLLGDRLQISGAFRAQFFTLDAPLFSPAASAPYQGIAFPSPAPAYTGDASIAYFFRKSGTKLRAHAGRGYRAPSLFERFGAGFDPVFGYSVYGDPRLTPEHSLGFDTGIDRTFRGGRLKTSATYFYTVLQNVINFDTSGDINPATDPFGRSIGYVNTTGGISRGVELRMAAAATRSLDITAAYTYVNAIERTPIVSDVLQTFVIPRHQFSVLATERVTPRILLTFDTLGSSSYLAPVYGETLTQVYRFPGLAKVNLGASYRLPLSEYRAVRFFVRTENLLNQTYFESGFLTPGRTALGGLEFEF
ncbi:MAG TPA: TonB-dependent receptor [Bryobacteraceae bacterium]|nr:TonB-dependent receptor [Bryobacteraceae bacterium]